MLKRYRRCFCGDGLFRPKDDGQRRIEVWKRAEESRGDDAAGALISWVTVKKITALYVHTYMHIYIYYVYIYVYIIQMNKVYTHIYVCIYIYAYVNICMYTCICIFIIYCL